MRIFLFIFIISNLFSFNLQKPALSGDFRINAQYENNSDLAKERNPPYNYNFSSIFSINWWIFNIGLNLLYTSDNKFTSQRINNFGFNLIPSIPSWKWIKLYFGDFSVNLSEYTLSGVSIHGAGLELLPSHWRFIILNGRTKEASNDFLNWSYKRKISGLKIGSEYLSLIFLKIIDDKSSLKPTDTIVPVPPQENLLLGFISSFKLLKIIEFNIEVTSSAHTRDSRSDTIYLKDIPEFLYSIYKPRKSTRFDIGIKGECKLIYEFINFYLGYERIGPGFTSLGITYIKNDINKWEIGSSTKIVPKTNLKINFEIENDNLLKDKVATTKNNTFNISLSTYPFPFLNISANHVQQYIKKDAQRDSFKLNSINNTSSIISNFNFRINETNNNLGISIIYQGYKNRTLFTQTPSTKAITSGINYSINFRIPLTLIFSFQQTQNFTQKVKTFNSYNCSIGIASYLFKNKLNKSFNISYQPSNIGNNILISATYFYSFTQRNGISINWYLNFFSSIKKEIKSFNSQNINLSYTHRIF